MNCGPQISKLIRRESQKSPLIKEPSEKAKLLAVLRLFWKYSTTGLSWSQMSSWPLPSISSLFRFLCCLQLRSLPGSFTPASHRLAIALSQCRIFVCSQLFSCQGAIFHRIPDKKSTVEIEWRFGRFCSVGFFHSTSTALGSFSVLSDPAPLGTVKSRYSIQL